MAPTARTSRARRALKQWSIAHPALRGLADLDGLLERRRDDRAAPAVLRALAVLAPGDDLAARTLLQALLPGLVRLAGIAGYDDPAAIEEMVSSAWERIRTYPAGRQGSVAANVLFDLRKRYRAHRRIDAPRSPDTEETAIVDLQPSENFPPWVGSGQLRACSTRHRDRAGMHASAGWVPALVAG